jgi:hypothetical protein
MNSIDNISIDNLTDTELNRHGLPRQRPGPKGNEVWGQLIKKGKVVGRQRVIVPPDEVEHLASLGCTNKEIAEYFAVDDSTLARNFAVELTKGRHNLRTRLRQAQLRVALEGNPTMLIFLGKCLLGQNESGMSDSNQPLPWSDDDEAEIDMDMPDLDQALESAQEDEYANTNP